MKNLLIAAKHLNHIFETDDFFTAVFNGNSEPISVTVSEINYRPDASLDGGNWFELHNYSSTALDLTGWSVKSSDFYNRTFQSFDRKIFGATQGC